MPEITPVHVVLFVAAMLIGMIAAWIVRGRKAALAKELIQAGWQEKIEDIGKEKRRLVEQNKSLMEQVSQLQASRTEATNRARELSNAVQEAFTRRDELQRKIKDIRSNLEVSLSERDRLQLDIDARDVDHDLLARKDERIEWLTRELQGWQDRLPPLIKRFRARNAEAKELEAELATARARIRELEESQVDVDGQPTRIEPVHDPEELTDGLEASNDPAGESDNDDMLVSSPVDEGEAAADANGDDDADEDEDEDEDDGIEDSHFGQRDDLKQIKGVGPTIEKTLNEMGIFSFGQIADLSEYEIDRVAQRLKGFRSRIYREDWIGQARELRDQGARL